MSEQLGWVRNGCPNLNLKPGLKISIYVDIIALYRHETHLPVMVANTGKEEVEDLKGAQTLPRLLYHHLHKSFSKFRKDSAKAINFICSRMFISSKYKF